VKSAEGNDLALPFFSDLHPIPESISLDEETRKTISIISRLYPFRISPFYAGLMDAGNPRCPIRLQAIPSIRELDRRGVEDPLGETDIAVTPSFFKRYPKRGVFLVTAECAMYCRFCNRRRLVGRGADPAASREETFDYLARSHDITEVVLSGGDPLMLQPDELGSILKRLRLMAHIRVIRISSRMPVVFPERIYPHLASLRQSAPLWFVVHINHPREMSPQFVEAVTGLRAQGLVVVSQSVLLRGVNDCPRILARLFEGLVEIGIKPYYLFQLDDVVGAGHFKVRVETGIRIMRSLRAEISGLCIPQYALDITGGLGKVPLESGYVAGRKGDLMRLRNLYGEEGTYLDDGEESTCLDCGLCRE
jgi:lysine 2,3-aminomutase